MTKAYLLGALHDGTTHKLTMRIAQKRPDYPLFIKQGIEGLGGHAWIYQEGKHRSVWICEFSKSFLRGTRISSLEDKVEYVRGYFDAEGGMARSSKVWFYIYFCQNDLNDLRQVRNYLEEIGISCGVIHNPSKKADPEYWRFYVRAKSYKKFANVIGSSHPEKSKILRMKI
jgi:hypothetical protein